MAVASIVRLEYEFHRLILQPDYIGFYNVCPGAIDLKMRFREVHGWFASKPAYIIMCADYPPVSYPILWLLLAGLTVMVRAKKVSLFFREP